MLLIVELRSNNYLYLYFLDREKKNKTEHILKY